MAIKINASIGTLGNTRKSDKPKPNQSQNIQQLTSGRQSKRAIDDTAGLAIAVRFAAQIGGSQQSYRNINDGISLAQTGAAAISALQDNLQRMRELATRSATTNLDDVDRESLQEEVTDLQDDIQRITSDTTFNGIALLDQQQVLEFQVGIDASDTISAYTMDLASRLNRLGIDQLSVSTADDAKDAIQILHQALTTLNDSRSEFNALQNRFEDTGRNLHNQEEVPSSAHSHIEDAEIAGKTAQLSRNLILQQADIAIQAQANTTRGLVLTLLKQ